MDKKGRTPKFTIDELRDKISQCKCGVRGQSRIFHQLDRNLEWTGDTISIETPVITYRSFQRKSNTFWLEVTIQRSMIYTFTVTVVVYLLLAIGWTAVLYCGMVLIQTCILYYMYAQLSVNPQYQRSTNPICTLNLRAIAGELFHIYIPLLIHEAHAGLSPVCHESMVILTVLIVWHYL